jgi:hypothetical protein
VLAALNDRSPNGWIGRRLRAMFVSAGLQEVDLQLVPILSTSYTEWNLRFGIERLVSGLVAQGAGGARWRARVARRASITRHAGSVHGHRAVVPRDRDEKQVVARPANQSRRA